MGPLSLSLSSSVIVAANREVTKAVESSGQMDPKRPIVREVNR